MACSGCAKRREQFRGAYRKLAEKLFKDRREAAAQPKKKRNTRF